MVRPWTPAEVGVSTREAEVLAALAEHLTNAEIAARLVISVRTVESHVSSLLRKFEVPDRRELANLAATMRPAAEDRQVEVQVRLPSPLTSFVGRTAERAALAAALDEHRLVTVVGPGGIGKTRLALSVAADVSDRYADGAWFVDLVAVADPAMIAPAVCDEVGLGEYQRRSAEDTLLDWLARRRTLIVLDNCEHLVDGVAVLLERLLAGSPGLTVLATSRARLLAPFEWAFPLPGLSLAAADGPGDAVELFVARAAAGGTRLGDADSDRIAAVCAQLDGIALAIELAAARVPSLGLDGLEAGLSDQLRLLTGHRRVDERHRSLRATLDWSYALLDGPAQAVLRRVAVFAAPFTADAAGALAGDWAPVPAGAVPAVLAELADQSLLIPAVGMGGTRYRALETIRQYGAERLAAAGEDGAARTRHRDWCVGTGLDLAPRATADATGWRAAFDRVADDMRAALMWAAPDPAQRAAARRLALVLADLSFDRGLPGQAQRRYEQAAALGADERETLAALDLAAGAAQSRHFGKDAVELRRQAAAVALRAGDRAAAAGRLARAAEIVNRAGGLIPEPPDPGAAGPLLAEARALADGDPSASARMLVAEAFERGSENVTAERAEQALAMARELGDPMIESGALDALTAAALAGGDVKAGAALALQRIDVLGRLRPTALTGFELADGYCMATECAVATGDLIAGRRLAERVRDLPFYREEGHLATARLMVVAALAGDWDETVVMSERFREGWERAGRPRAGNLSRGAYAAATVYGLRGDDAGRAMWLDLVGELSSVGRPIRLAHFGEFFDALLWLHRGEPDRALAELDTPLSEFNTWYNGMWLSWYAAVRAEAALQVGTEAEVALVEARYVTRDNPVAAAIVARSAALADGDGAGVAAAAQVLLAAGCGYQWARTLVLGGGSEAARGEAVLERMGATPTAPW